MTQEWILRNCDIPECVIEQLCTCDRAVFNSDRRYYSRSPETDTYLDMIAETENQADIFFTAAGMIDIPTEREILAVMGEIRENPQDFRFAA